MRILNLQKNDISQNAPSFFQKGAQTLKQWMSFTVNNMQVGVYEIKNHPSMQTIIAANTLFFVILYSASNYLEQTLIDQNSTSKLEKVCTKILFNGILVGGLTSTFNVFLSKSLKQPLSQSSSFVITTTAIALRIILNKIFKSEDNANFSSENPSLNTPKLNALSSNTPIELQSVSQTDELQQKLKTIEDNKQKALDAVNKKKEIELANIQKKIDAANKLNQEKLEQHKQADEKAKAELQQKLSNIQDEFKKKKEAADKLDKENALKWEKAEAAAKAKHEADLADLDKSFKASLEKLKPKPAPQIVLGNFFVGLKFNVLDPTTYNLLEIYENEGKVNALLISFLFNTALFIPEEEINWLSSKPNEKSQLKNPQNWLLDGIKVIYNEPNPKAVDAEQLGMKHAAKGLFILKVMGVDSNLDEAQLKKQIKNYLLKNHPDKNPNADKDFVMEVIGLLDIINHGFYKHYQLGLGEK